MNYKYWNVAVLEEECLFSKDEFKTKDELIEYLEKNNLAEPDNIEEFTSNYEIKSVCLSYGRHNEFNFKCPYCGKQYNPDAEYEIYEHRGIVENFAYFDRYAKVCEKNDCQRIFILKNEYEG